jgi:hypothetical protein
VAAPVATSKAYSDGMGTSAKRWSSDRRSSD